MSAVKTIKFTVNLSGSDFGHIRKLVETKSPFLDMMRQHVGIDRSNTYVMRAFKEAVRKEVKRRHDADGVDLEFQEVWNKITKQRFRCAISGLYFQILPGLAVDGGNPMKLSIDKISRNLDTYKNNFQVSTWYGNRAKSTGTMEDFINFCRAVVNMHDRGDAAVAA